jgi:anaphase-promoting complex subunit 4
VPTLVCLVRASYSQPTSSSPFHIGVVLLECCLTDDVDDRRKRLDSFDLLEADFFDDESIVVVFRLRTEDSKPEARCKGRC